MLVYQRVSGLASMTTYCWVPLGCCGQTLAAWEQARKDAITLPWWHRHCSLTFVAHSCAEKSYRLSIWAQLFSVKHMSRILPSQQYESHLGPSSKPGMDKQTDVWCVLLHPQGPQNDCLPILVPLIYDMLLIRPVLLDMSILRQMI